jgi:GAF domain-containing protein
VLSLFTDQEHEFTNEEIDFAQRLAEQAGIAIHNSPLHERRIARVTVTLPSDYNSHGSK